MICHLLVFSWDEHVLMERNRLQIKSPLVLRPVSVDELVAPGIGMAV